MDDRTPRPPNTRLVQARRRLSSPSGSGRVMSRQELAEAANAYLWATYRERASMDRGYIGKPEQGRHRWPRQRHREVLRHVLGVAADADLGFFIIRRDVASHAADAPPAPASEGVAAGGEERDVDRREILTGVAAPEELDGLATRMRSIHQAYQHSRYASALSALPALLLALARLREHGGVSMCRLSGLDAEA